MKNSVKTAILVTAVATASLGPNITQIFAADTGGAVEDAQKTLDQSNQTLQSAKTTLDSANQAYQSAQADVNRLTSEKSEADTKLSDAKTQLEQAQNEYDGLKEKADSITEEDLTNAQQALTDATNAADAAQAEADKASKALDDANAIYNDASTQLTNAQNAYNEALEAQSAAQQALEAAKAEQAKAEEDAKQAESDKNTAQDNAKSAEENAKSVEEANPDAEKNAKDAKNAADKADDAQEDAQKDADDASKAKGAAESEKNTAETDVNTASKDVTNANKDVNDKTSDVKNAEEAQTASQAAFDNANKTLMDETAKAGDAQAQADQEVKDQQAVVDQKTAEKEDADKALEEAKAEQSEKQTALDDAKAKLNDAKQKKADAEESLKSKKDALIKAEQALENAHGDVKAKQNAVRDAQAEVDAAQANVDKAAKKVDDLKTSQDNKAKALEDAKAAVDKAKKAQKDAEQALKDIEDSRMITTIYASSDPVNKPVPADLDTVFRPSIPEAKGAKVTYAYDRNENFSSDWPTEDDMKIINSLNRTGSWAPTYKTRYWYPDPNQEGVSVGYFSPHPELGDPISTEQALDIDGGRNLKAEWTDTNGVKHTKHILLRIREYDIIWNTNDYKAWAKSVVNQIITPDMTSAQKADAITKYVANNFTYSKSPGGYNMLKTGSGDCWASADMVATLGEAAGFKAIRHLSNYLPNSGDGHENAWLYSPEDGKYYNCEAGYERSSKNSNLYDVTDITDGGQYGVNKDGIVMDRTKATYSEGFYSGGAEEIPGVIGMFANYGATEVHVPTDPKYTTLGGRSDGYFPYGPFADFSNLQTVYVGKNITTIRPNAYQHYELSSPVNGNKSGYYSNAYKWVIDPANPNYASDKNGALYQKNADGTKTLLATPSGRNWGISSEDYYNSLSKTQRKYTDDYNTANTNLTNANNSYNSANSTYELLMKDDFAKAIADAETSKEAAQKLLDTAKSNKTNADNVLGNAKKTAAEAETDVTNANTAVTEAVKKVNKAQEAVENAQNPVADATKSLDDAKAVVSEKQGAVDKAQSAVDDAEKVLSEKKEAAAKGAPQSLLDARKAVDKAQADLKTKEKALTDANKALDSAKKTLADKKDALDKANETLEDKKKALTKAENTLSEKNDALAKAKEASQKAHDDLDKANTAYQSIVDAKAKSDDAATALKDAQEKLDKANKTLADTKADVENKSKELDSANEKAKDLLEQLGLAQSDADTKKISADDAKKLYDEKASALYEGKATEANAKAALDDLVNTLNRRDELEKEINDLNESIPDYEKDAEALSAQLDTAKATAASTETVYNSAKQTYDAIVAAQSKTITYAASEISVNADGTMSFRSNADLTKFKGVQVDGKDVDPSQYTLSQGSTVVNLKKSFVDSLGKGNHTITIISEDGSASTSFVLNDKGASIVTDQTSSSNTATETKASESAKTTSNSTQAYVTSTPDTSDVTESAPWVFMVVVSLVTVGGVVYLKHSHE